MMGTNPASAGAAKTIPRGDRGSNASNVWLTRVR
jgi:hypothetical protein